ncbi:MAG: GDSL-type esterase/lipase family protein [Candidatus Omnitrophota bacterium]|jgi:lysophospholipase L1-like esterase
MKRNRFLILVFVSLCVLGLIGCTKREIANTASRGKNIICFGDSITFGYGANTGEDFPTQLGKLIDMPVINAGVSGDTSTEGLERLDSDVLQKDPYLVLIEFGGNDFIKNVPEEVTTRNTEEMIDRIQAQGAMVALIDISAGMFMGRYRGLFARIAARKKAIFIPSILDKIITNPSMKSDFLHPNAAGYREIALRIQNKTALYLKK